MDVIDYNGGGQWSRAQILARYAKYAAELGMPPHDLSPTEHAERNCRWVYPVMEKVIDGIVAGDPACVCLGIEFIEENGKFPFGKRLKSNMARALRHASLTQSQKQRVRQRVFGLLRAGHIPHEYREYAKLARVIGFRAEEVPDVDASNRYAVRFRSYFLAAARSSACQNPAGQ